MPTKSVTLALNLDLYRDAVAYARKREISLNVMIRDLLLKEIYPTDSNWVAEMFEVMDSARKTRTPSKWDRDEIYE